MNNGNNLYKLNSQHPPLQSTNDAIRPLMDVAHAYCRNLNPLTSEQKIPLLSTPRPQPRIPPTNFNYNNEVKENNSISISLPEFGFCDYTPQGNPYSWKSKSMADPKSPHASGNTTPVAAASPLPFTRPHNPYSWKASSKPSSTPSTESEENIPSSIPRPPKMRLPKQLPKMDALTISISRDSDYRDVSEEMPQPSPLQPFSPTGNSRDCSCHRSPKVILCQSCGLIQRGRLSMACSVHPRKVFLMDLNCCSGCKSTSLKEICDAKKRSL